MTEEIKSTVTSDAVIDLTNFQPEVKQEKYTDSLTADKQTNEERINEICKREKLVKIYPEKNQLFIDIDNEHSYNTFLINFPYVKQIPDLKSVYIKWMVKSKSEKPFHFHIIIDTGKNFEENKEGLLLRRLYQLMLGSDPVRESLNIIQGNAPFFFRKEDRAAVKCWEADDLSNDLRIAIIYIAANLSPQVLIPISVLHIYYLLENNKIALSDLDDNSYLRNLDAVTLSKLDCLLLKQYMDIRELKYTPDPAFYNQIKETLLEVWDNEQS